MKGLQSDVFAKQRKAALGQPPPPNQITAV